MRIAVVGSGIAGMGSALTLSENTDLHLFEIEKRMGRSFPYRHRNDR